jgi:hypothetical protein
MALLGAPALLVACVLGGSRATLTTHCRPADGASQSLINHLKQMMTTTDSAEIFARDNYFHVPVVSARQVRLATDAPTCERASAAYGPPTESMTKPRVYVVKLGSKGFAVLDPEQLAGEYQTVKIFDRKWVSIGGWTGP